MKTVGIGMLGAGFIGQMHSLAFKAAAQAKANPRIGARFVALADVSGQFDDIRERFEWESVSRDWRDIFSTPGVDLFVNAGPNSAHAEPVAAAAAKGIPVFCEKPLARTANEAFDIWQSVETRGVPHMCAFVHRFVPALQLMRQMIQQGDIGDVRHFRSDFLMDMKEGEAPLSWRFSRNVAGGGASADLGSHHIDQARFLVGEIASVVAMTRTWTKARAPSFGEVNDDWMGCVAELEQGATAVFEAARTADGHALTGRIEVDGTRGTLAWDMTRVSEIVHREPKKGMRTFSATMQEHPYSDFWLPVGIQGAFAVGWRDSFYYQARHVLSAVAGGTPIAPLAATFRDGYRVAEIVDAILESAASGQRKDVVFRGA
ncbi:MAG TPA: Gfo/Idh/MocA family oxidoreductase [Bauldia sp.]|nr:Gfo/Idh/MocA family oxidoreductase [Bauldia sp.]